MTNLFSFFFRCGDRREKKDQRANPPALPCTPVPASFGNSFVYKSEPPGAGSVVFVFVDSARQLISSFVCSWCAFVPYQVYKILWWRRHRGLIKKYPKNHTLSRIIRYVPYQVKFILNIIRQALPMPAIQGGATRVPRQSRPILTFQAGPQQPQGFTKNNNTDAFCPRGILLVT